MDKNLFFIFSTGRFSGFDARLMMVMSSTMTCHILMWLSHQFITEKYYFFFAFSVHISKQQRATNKMSTSIEHKHDYDVMICYLFSVYESSIFVCCLLMRQKFFFNFEKTRMSSYCLLQCFLSCSLQWELVNLLLCILFNQITIKIKITQLNQLTSAVHKKNDPTKFNGVIILIAQWWLETVQGPSIAPKNTHTTFDSHAN